jgi:hemerythrin-like domain-containing protein
MRSLPETSHEHHARIQPHVDRLPGLAARLDRQPDEAFAADFAEEYRFIVGQLVPHIAAIETTLYDRLEALMAGRHSMAPMRAEHEELRHLIETLGDYRPHVEAGTLDAADAIGLRRALYRLYALLKVHLAEEELYLAVLEQHLSDAEKDELARGIEHAANEPL